MDVISLYQNGIHNVTASLGTALTENQGRLISRYTKNVVLSYDADNAGINAAMRGIDIIRKAECDVRVLQINDGKDPDEFVRKNGKERFLELIRNAVPATDFRLSVLRRGFDFKSDNQVLEYIRRCVPVLEQLSPVEQDIYIRKLSRSSGFPSMRLPAKFERTAEKQAARVPQYRNRREHSQGSSTEIRMDFTFLVLAMANRYYVKKNGSGRRTLPHRSGK